MKRGFVGVHIGAGYHSKSKTDQYLYLCKEICKMTTEELAKGATALQAVTKAVELLENSPITNAGVGSNLNNEQTVECDACIMDGQTLHFGAVGAVKEIKNPIRFASQILHEQMKAPHPLGIIPPCILVGPCANKWAQEHGIIMCTNEELVTEESLRQNKRYRTRLNDFENQERTSKIRRLDDVCNINTLLDTVGAIVVDDNGNVAAAASSGGLILKQPGRVGQVANYGSGAWAQNATSDHSAVATATTGCGEYLIKTCFAKECAHQILTSETPAKAMEEAIKFKFLESPFLKNSLTKIVGVIALEYDPITKHGEFMWAHTAKTMCVGYMSVNAKLPVAKMSTLPQDGQPGCSIVVEGISLNFST